MFATTTAHLLLKAARTVRATKNSQCGAGPGDTGVACDSRVAQETTSGSHMCTASSSRSATTRMCVKEAHSCCRKIVSTQWEVKRKWKQIGRAMETMTIRCSGGTETWTLKLAASEPRDRIQRGEHSNAYANEQVPEVRNVKATVGKNRRRRPVLRGMPRVECAPRVREIGAVWIRQTGTTTITVESCNRRKARAGGAQKVGICWSRTRAM